MERKKTAEKTKTTTTAKAKTMTAAKASHSAKSHSQPKRTTHRATAANKTDRTYTVISNEPEDMAVLSESQQAAVFDMSASEDPTGDSQAVRDARVRAALEPLGTEAAIQPIITEDGVITPYAR